MTRDELALEAEHLDLLDRLATAKDRWRTDKTDAARTDLREAKLAIQAFRDHWRTIRTAFNPDATVPTLNVEAKVK